MRYFFVQNDIYTDEIVRIIEVIPDMNEVIEKKDKTKYDSILEKCKIKVIKKYVETFYEDNVFTSDSILYYDPRSEIAFSIFHDEEWMLTNHPPEIDPDLPPY